MKSLNIRGKQRKNGQYYSYKGEVGKIAENILNRDFTASKPFEKLTTDVTQFQVCNDKVYLSPVMDLYNREIIAYSISLRPNLAQIREMLQGLTDKLPDGATPIFHSDQGWQYQHKQYQQMLKCKGIQQSMSRKGNCLDNAVMENFFGLLKSELLYLQEFESVEHFKQELLDYLDYYNNRRIKARLKGLPPAIHRQQALSAAWTIFDRKYCLTFWGHFNYALFCFLSKSFNRAVASLLARGFQKGTAFSFVWGVQRG